MAKLIYSGDQLVSAVLDSPQECTAVIAALRYASDPSTNNQPSADDLNQIQVTLRHLSTPSPPSGPRPRT